MTTLATALTFPDSTAVSYYQQTGTAISFSSLSGNSLQNVLLSPSSNPYGSGANANGVYVIDCQGNNLSVQNCRIVGTLVILNPGSGTTIQNSVVCCPAVSNYPCLMVNGSITINQGNNYLSEGNSQNYNPPGTPYPYPTGTSNTTGGDLFPPSIQGLIYVAGNLTIQGSELAANVIVVGGSCSIGNAMTLYLSYDPTYYKSPPPGLGTIQMAVSPGSWQPVAH